MKISYEWLKDYIEIDKTPEQLAEDLSLFGHEVEGIEKVGDDFVLDFEITPNRGDCLSILGMAREIAALYDKNLSIKDFSVEVTELGKTIGVEVSAPEICPRYTARIIESVKVGPSPEWMVKRLASYGFRSINNIVDVTNYVMLATGQPLHAFDYDKIQGGLMNIRLSKEGDEVITLDGYTRKLPDGAAVICDDEKIYDLAGIMGGFKSEVDDKTKTIVLQGAIFDPVTIRKASKFLKLQTDASYRYERGVDFEGTVYAVQMASNLILETSPGGKAGKLIDEIFLPQKKKEIKYEPARINRLLGTNLSDDEMAADLTRLKFDVNGDIATVPSYRFFDVKIWQDLAEEVARIYGYNNLEKNNLEKKAPKKNLEFMGTEKLKDILVEVGFSEIYSYSFADKNKMEPLGFDPQNQPQIENPLSPETKYLRPSILTSLVTAVARNPWSPDVNIFEMEAVFGKEEEFWQLGLATAGKSDALIKKALEILKIKTSVENVEQKILDNFKIRRLVKYAIIDIEKISLPAGDYSLEISANKYRPISKFPPTVRDLAFIVDNNVSSEKVTNVIKDLDEHILLVELFDEFTSDKFGEDKKNIAFHVWLQEQNSELSLDKVNDIIRKIIDDLKTKYSAVLRSK